jgi:DNA-binding transcriptional MerR regulator
MQQLACAIDFVRDLKMLHSTSSASRLLGVPISTLRSWEVTGAIGPFQRDGGGRRVITEADILQIRAYMNGRRLVQGLEPEAEIAIIDTEGAGN